jgi:hypothetical protein
VAPGPSAASFECGVDLLWLACAIRGSASFTIFHAPKCALKSQVRHTAAQPTAIGRMPEDRRLPCALAHLCTPDPTFPRHKGTTAENDDIIGRQLFIVSLLH